MQQDYLLPMAAAIWSCPTETMLKFPAQSFLQFFANHGLLNVNDRPQWRTVINGARTYLEKIVAFNRFAVHQYAVTDVALADTDGRQCPYVAVMAKAMRLIRWYLPAMPTRRMPYLIIQSLIY